MIHTYLIVEISKKGDEEKSERSLMKIVYDVVGRKKQLPGLLADAGTRKVNDRLTLVIFHQLLSFLS